jgi:hypothetical protein
VSRGQHHGCLALRSQNGWIRSFIQKHRDDLSVAALCRELQRGPEAVRHDDSRTIWHCACSEELFHDPVLTGSNRKNQWTNLAELRNHDRNPCVCVGCEQPTSDPRVCEISRGSAQWRHQGCELQHAPRGLGACPKIAIVARAILIESDFTIV